LTLNYGIRYEKYGVPHNTGAAKDALVQLGTGQSFGQRLASAKIAYPVSGDEQLYKPDNNDWAPRIGFSYDLTANAKPLVRGAYGIFYDRPYDNLWQNVRTNNFILPSFPLSGTVNYLAGSTAQLKSLDGRFLDTSFPNLTLVDPNMRDAYVHSFFWGVRHQVTENWTLEVNTLGSLGRKI